MSCDAQKQIAIIPHFTFIRPCIANILAEYNQQDATFHNLFLQEAVHVSDSFFSPRPSSGAQNCTTSIRYLSEQYCYLPLALTFHNFFISVRRSTCFRRVFCPSSGAQNCTYSVRYLSDQCCYLPLPLTFHNFFISVRRSECFRRFFCPSSGAQNCTYSVRHLSDQYCYLLLTWPARLAAGSSIGLALYVQFRAPNDGQKKRLKHVERLTEINKL